MSPNTEARYRRSARLTPSRLHVNARSPNLFNVVSSILSPVGKKSSRKSLAMDGAGGTMVHGMSELGISPLSPTSAAQRTVSGGKAPRRRDRRDRRGEKKPKSASAPKRGEYRCGKCGFFPKKTKHDCAREAARMSLGEAGQPAPPPPPPAPESDAMEFSPAAASSAISPTPSSADKSVTNLMGNLGGISWN